MIRVGLACILAILAGIVTASANDRQDAIAGPSHLEYLILASVADATRPVSLVTYLPTPQK
jgi:hypothetical protein